eukprot:scaffold259023_cov21-Tisochrysis_lutea.AAC.1
MGSTTGIRASSVPDSQGRVFAAAVSTFASPRGQSDSVRTRICLTNKEGARKCSLPERQCDQGSAFAKVREGKR